MSSENSTNSLIGLLAVVVLILAGMMFFAVRAKNTSTNTVINQPGVQPPQGSPVVPVVPVTPVVPRRPNNGPRFDLDINIVNPPSHHPHHPHHRM